MFIVFYKDQDLDPKIRKISSQIANIQVKLSQIGRIFGTLLKFSVTLLISNSLYEYVLLSLF